jgi:hypothetical protein
LLYKNAYTSLRISLNLKSSKIYFIPHALSHLAVFSGSGATLA